MTEKIKELWSHYGRWFTLGILLAALTLSIAVWQTSRANRPLERTTADPLAESEITFDLERNRAYTSEDGIVVIQPTEEPEGESETPETNSATLTSNPDQIWESAELSAEDYTLPEEIKLEDGSIGTLVIPKLDLTASVYETEDEMESMTKGIAHFTTTTAWDGNIGLCSHNVAPKGAVAFFRDIHQLKQGDSLVYKTLQGERHYQVTQVLEIAQDDWGYLGRTEDNRITLITCITGKPEKRLMVQAVEE